MLTHDFCERVHRIAKILPSGALSSTPSSQAMNAAGTIIVGRATDGTNSFIGKWTWNVGTQTWDGPENLGSNLTTPATWLPNSVLSCGVPPTIGSSIAMNDDASIIVGSATYSTCGSFMTGGFIYHTVSGEPVMEDWYDFNNQRGVPGVAPGGQYGPVGDAGDPARGLPALGAAVAVSPDGSAFAGFQFGTQIVIGAVPWVLIESGDPSCVAPTITNNPSATTNFSACTSSIILNVAASGTTPFTYQWYKDGNPLSNGAQPSGSNVTGADSFQLRVNSPLTPSDAGTYYAVITGGCGSPATSSNAVVQLDPAFPAAVNDTCATATNVAMGTNVLGAGESPCGAYINDPIGGASCVTAGTKTDRWYRFTPPASGNYRIETCGANFDTALSVFADCSGNELACNNDYTSGPTTGCTSSRSRILSVSLTGSTPYLVRISAPTAAFLSGTSLMNMSITAAPLPAANDNCFSATTAVNGANPFDLNEATNDFAASCNTALSRDVWFNYTATATGNVRFTTCPGTLNTVLSIYDSCYGSELACNDNAVGISGCTSPSLIDNFAVNAGTHYIIRVGTNSVSTVGAGNLTITPQGCDSIDFNNDTSVFDPQDIDAFLSVYSEGPCIPETSICSDIDFNNDSSVFDPCDISSFLQVFSEGPCALCPL
ncbi:MAG: immunoglobulin domain-containing protein [Phycisphaerales bacterium]